MSSDCGCKDCKRVREHVASLLPFKVLEAAEGKPLRISGIAMAAGISRNFNIYTPEELQAFAEKLIGAPIYLEHVTANEAVGKTTNAFYDQKSRCIMYEAEVYDEPTAEKLRNGLIRHVSVGADYQAIDLVDAAVPHGLYNAELSLVAVPGMPETTIQVLEHLQSQVNSVGVEKLDEKDAESIAERVVSKISEKSSLEVENLKKQLTEAESKKKEAEAARDEAKKQLSAANLMLEQYHKIAPGVDLLASPPVLMSVSEHIAVLEKLLPVPMVERSSMFAQRQCQDIRAAVLKAKERLK